MDADERLVALKRAYADIILNTSKEAAARVLISEKKAFRLEKELNDFKGQALQMLLRSKKMLDCKVLESEMTSYKLQKMIQELNGQLRDATDRICKAEATSLRQNKKIEELEAQLNEAEDIVKDLREELKEAHIQVERVRKNKPPSNDIILTSIKDAEVHIDSLNLGAPNLLSPTPAENTLNTSQPLISSLSPVSHEKIPTLTDSSERKAFIPSILLKSKGPEVCGNRRTQRIRAFEEKLMAGELTFTHKTNNVDANHDWKAKENGVEAGDTYICGVEKKVPKFGAHGQKWRKLARCKAKKISNIDLYNRARKTIKTQNDVSEEESSDSVLEPAADAIEKTCFGHEIVGVSDAMFTRNEMIETETPGTDSEIDGQPEIDRVIKYTFQRKRKREYISSSDGLPPGEEAVLKKSTVERPNCPQEMEKCGSLIESSRDSRRLAVVAHQLISLSEKKW